MRLVLAGDPPIEIALRRSRRARRLSLRVSRLDGRVTLSLPCSVGEAEAAGFARAKEGWLRRVLDGAPPHRAVRQGDSVPVEGRETPIRLAPVRCVQMRDEALLVPEHRPAGPLVATFLRALARERVDPLVARHAASVGRHSGRITLRDTRSRWGSCSAKGDLMFSWRLVMAPPEVLDYVVAHEVAHLVHMNHAADFWSLTARLCPHWRQQRRWLRGSGDTLMRIDFHSASDGEAAGSGC